MIADFKHPQELFVFLVNHIDATIFFYDNLKIYAFMALKVSQVPTNLTIAVIFNTTYDLQKQKYYFGIITLIARCINGFFDNNSKKM